MTLQMEKKKRLFDADYCVDTEIRDQIDYVPTWEKWCESAIQVGAESVRHGYETTAFIPERRFKVAG